MLYRLSRLALHRGDRIEARRLLQSARDGGIERLRGDLTRQLRELDEQLDAPGPPQG
jgi:hypothetical protein